MSAVLLLASSRLGASWRSGLVIAALIGLGGGTALAVAAGARRTASANDAVLRRANASDAGGSFSLEHPDEMLPLLRAVPDVEDVSLMVGFIGRLEGHGLRPSTLYFHGLWSDDPTVDRPLVLAGRLPMGRNEVFLNESAVTATGLRIGSPATMALASPVTIHDGAGELTRTEVTVVGTGLLADEVIEDELGHRPLVLLSRALTLEQLENRSYTVVGLSLTRGDLTAVSAGLAKITDDTGAPRIVIERTRTNDRARVQTALRPLVTALAGFAALAGVTTAVVATQALSRTARRRAGEDQALIALGCTRIQLVGADLAFTLPVAAVGAALAVASAVLASPLFPIGPARRVSGAIGGVEVDAIALGLGALGLVLAVSTLVGVGSWRRRSHRETVSLRRTPGFTGWSPTASAGLALVSGRRGLKVTTAGVAGGLAAVVATLTFTGSLEHLAANPGLAGMSWDVVARENFTGIDTAAVRDGVRGDPSVHRVTGLGYVQAEMKGVPLPGAQVSAVLGSPWPPVSRGRLPESSSEIMVGHKTLGAMGLNIGDQVVLTLKQEPGLGPRPAAVPHTVTVVGSAVVPAIGQAGIATPRLAQGVVMGPETADKILGPGGVPSFVYLFDLAPGTDPQALVERFPDGLPDTAGLPTEWFTSAVPAEVRQAVDARGTAWLGVGALGLAVVVTIGHTLMGSVRDRRRDYAVLKAVGFTRGQIRSTVLWQSGIVLGAALVVALPIGIAAGRWLWIAFAQSLGVVVRPVVPVLLLAGTTMVAALAIQGGALVPATIARRTPAGRALHVE